MKSATGTKLWPIRANEMSFSEDYQTPLARLNFYTLKVQAHKCKGVISNLLKNKGAT